MSSGSVAGLARQPEAIAITSHKPTSRYLRACPDLDYSRFADFRYLIPFTLLKMRHVAKDSKTL